MTNYFSHKSKSINRFCKLIQMINETNHRLELELSTLNQDNEEYQKIFIEENKTELQRLASYQDELEILLLQIAL